MAENCENKNWMDQKFCLTMPVSSLNVIIKMPVPVSSRLKAGSEACQDLYGAGGQIDKDEKKAE